MRTNFTRSPTNPERQPGATRVGGWVIIDDCGAAPGCKKAVDDGRAENNTIEPMKWTNWTGTYRQRQRRRAASPARIQ